MNPSSSAPLTIGPPIASRPHLTRTQQLIWASQRLNPGVPLANMGDRLRIRGPLDPGRFVAAFDAVVRHAECLRLALSDTGNAARVRRDPPAATTVLDLAVDQLEDWSSDRIAKPLDPTDCVYDSVLLRHGDNDWTWWIDVHHVAADAWSAALVIDTTAVAYAHDGDPHDADLTAVAHPDFFSVADAITQTDPDDPDRATRRRTWQEQEAAAGAPAPLTLYGPRGPRTTSVTRRGLDFGAAADVIETALTGRFRSLSPELGRLTLAAMATLISVHRLDGRDEVTVGVPVHHRAGPAKRAIGPLMELYPLRLNFDPDESHDELFRRTLRAIMKLLSLARPGESPDTPFEIVLNVTTAKYGEFAGLAAQREWMRSGHVDPNHLLRVQVFDRFDPDAPPDQPRRVEWELDLNDGLSADGSHDALPRHFAAVIRSIVQAPDAPAGRAPVVDTAERAQLALLNPDPGPRTHDRPIHEQIRTVLDADPDRVVVEENQRVITAAEFDREADRVARALCADGLRAGQAVGLRLGRSIDVLVAIHAVLRAGGRFVLLDPADPPNRHERIRTDAELFVILDELPSDIVGGIELPTVSVDDGAYVLYTSGSTGEPKGVPISHRGLADYLAFAVDTYAFDNHTAPVVALHSSLVFDLTITSLFLGFLTGGRTIVFADDPVEALGKIAADDRITFLKATPSQLEILTRVADGSLGLHVVVVGGEAFRRPVAERLRLACGDHVRIFNEYGPTEAVVGCMIHEYSPDTDRGADVPIGTAAPGTQLAVLDPLGQLTPPGSWGELHVRRVGMATEYLNREELSRDRFAALPIAGPDEVALGRVESPSDPPWYRTGDRVRVERPGVLVYGGRNDDQVKVNGIRLEPGEVEAALVELSGIDNALVRLWRPEPRERRAATVRRCRRCGLGTDVPGLELDADDVCSICHDFDAIEPQTRAWFRTEEQLAGELTRARARRRGDHDCLHLLSGGKDSTYALYQLVERGWNVHALTLDNGFIAEGAKENIRRSIADLGITHEFVTTDAMNEIFRDSLERHSNVCQGCYKTIYTLAVARAEALGIPTIVTGLSRGQFFETRLIPHQFEKGRFDPEEIDRTVLEARHVYHHTDDAVTRLLPEQSVFDDDEVLERVEFVDFYRYVDVELAEMYDFLEHRAPWVRPADTGRSTNCLINIAGIRTHLNERGYHNYAEPYSWDVRLGHKTRDEALDELDDEIDESEVERLLNEIGYEPEAHGVLTGWYQTSGDDLDPDDIRAALRDSLPDHAIPAAFVRVGELPLAASAKIDTTKLPAPSRFHRQGGERVAPRTPTEQRIADIWAEVLGLESVGVTDDFFDIGGASLAALEVAARIDAAFETELPDAIVFRHRTIDGLAAMIDGGEQTPTEPRPDPTAAPVGSGPPPLSPAEEAMLFEYRADPADTRYNGARLYSLRGSVDPVALQAAVRDVVAHHPPLHTTFDPARTELRRDAAVEWHDLATLDPERMADIASRECNRPFDLDRGPLVRVHFARTGATDHELLITMPHIVSDAGSFDTFWRQVAVRAGGGALPELPLHYAEHMARQRARHRADDSSARFWAARSSNRRPARRIGFPTPASPEPDGYLERSTGLTAATTQVRGSTPFATSLAALAAVVSTHTGGADVEIGVTVSTKDGAGTEPVVGCYLNTVTTMLTVRPDERFGELVDAAGAEVAAVLPHRTYPFASVVRDARAEGRPEPDISIILAYERHDDPEFPGADATQRVLTSDTAVTDATFFVHEHDDEIRLGIEYRGTTLSAAHAGRLLDAFADIFAEGVTSPSTAIATLTAPHRGDDLVGAELDSPPETVLARIARQVADRPAALAVTDAGGGSLTYADLAVAAVGLATRIESQLPATTAHPRVGVSVARSVDLVVALVAAQLAGGAHVALDPSIDPARVERIASQAGLDVVVTDDATRRFGHERLVVLDGPEPPESDPIAAFHERVRRITSDQVAYVIYTSGSTGEPRGVAVTHANLAVSTGARDHWFDAPPRRFLLTSSAGFDSAMVGLYWPLATGGTVVLPGDDDVHDVDRLGDLIADSAISHVLMVPSLAQALLDRAAARLRGLDTCIVAGEACPTPLARRHFELLPDVALVNEYGPTEATVWASAHRVQPGDDPVPIGGPIPGATLRVADENLEPVPVDVAGELLISGPGVTAGYLDEAAVTAERFVTVGRQRWYRTGDVVREVAGALQFLGRNDDQLNVGGVRVEPVEIERELDRLDDVVASVVVAAGSPAILVAHVERATGGSIDESGLRRTLGRRLPTTMVPRRLIEQDALPRTPHGKIDRAAAARLAVPTPTVPTGDTGGEPATGLVATVVDVWRIVLADTTITAESDFFDAGGDSLTAVAIATALGDRIGRNVPIATLLSAPSPAGMAALLEPAAGSERSVVRAVRLRPGTPTGPLVVMTPAWDDVFGYQALAEAFPPPVEIVALVHEPEPDQTPLTRVPDLVAEMLEAVDGIDTADRPFAVLGWSIGGVSAVELTAQLSARPDGGADMVALVDTFHPGEEKHLWSNRWWKYKSMLRWKALPEFGREVRSFVRRRVLAPLGRRLLDWAGQPVAETTTTRLVGSFPAEAFEHRPAPPGVPMIFYRATTTNPERTIRRWRELTEPIIDVEVDGRHRGFDSIMYPGKVDRIATDLTERLLAERT